MKATALLEQLQALVAEHGDDVEVAYVDQEAGGFKPVENVDMESLYKLGGYYDYSTWSSSKESKVKVLTIW